MCESFGLSKQRKHLCFSAAIHTQHRIIHWGAGFWTCHLNFEHFSPARSGSRRNSAGKKGVSPPNPGSRRERWWEGVKLPVKTDFPPLHKKGKLIPLGSAFICRINVCLNFLNFYHLEKPRLISRPSKELNQLEIADSVWPREKMSLKGMLILPRVTVQVHFSFLLCFSRF